jgi:hypothetical protein
MEDMAEKYFPVKDARTGVGASVLALSALLSFFVASVHFILKVRDIH